MVERLARARHEAGQCAGVNDARVSGHRRAKVGDIVRGGGGSDLAGDFRAHGAGFDQDGFRRHRLNESLGTEHDGA